MLNHITLMGRLTRDPELRQTQSNTAVANFSLAVDRDIPNKATGQRETDFIDCVGWGHTANFVSKYCSKGSLIAVDGRLQIRDWTDKDGNKRRAAEVNVNSVYFSDKKADNAERGSSTPAVEEPEKNDYEPAADDSMDLDSDLPF